MDSLPVIHGKKIVQKSVRFLSKKAIESMHRSAIIQGQKIGEARVRLSIKWTIESMDRLALMHAQKYCLNNP